MRCTTPHTNYAKLVKSCIKIANKKNEVYNKQKQIQSPWQNSETTIMHNPEDTRQKVVN